MHLLCSVCGPKVKFGHGLDQGFTTVLERRCILIYGVYGILHVMGIVNMENSERCYFVFG